MAKRLKKGFVHVYTGNGKGKTTAAIGLGVRAYGSGLSVCLYQFLKGKGITYGELKATARFGPRFKIIPLGQVHPYFRPLAERRRIREGLKKSIKSALKDIKRAMLGKRYDLIILDEFITAIRDGFVDLKSVIKLIDSKPKEIELVLTGRSAPKALRRYADYVTEMRNIKHPFSNGVRVRRGIEF